MEIPNRDLATARAAELVLANLERQLVDPTNPIKLISQALLPVFGIRWDADVIRRVSPGRLRKILWSLRNSKLSTQDYNRVRDLWVTGFGQEIIFPAAWEAWRSLIERFNLDDELRLEAWLPIVDTIIKLGWKEPSHLALADFNSFNAIATHHAWPPTSAQLWKASVIVFAPTSAASTLNLKGASADAETLIEKIKNPIKPNVQFERTWSCRYIRYASLNPSQI